ncbi:hypothetical protein KV564_10095 [Paenibacillus chitinolyticus]|nr:hypothetical protein [Paenibacillus chitinolyticus]
MIRQRDTPGKRPQVLPKAGGDTAKTSVGSLHTIYSTACSSGAQCSVA